jgi:poly(A) polymerase
MTADEDKELAGLAPVHHSALAIVPPQEAWPAIQALRRRHDRHVDRWMPHLNLLYGFVPAEHFAAAAAAAARALADFPPFTVTLDGYDTFTHRRSATAWLRPRDDPPDSVRRLQARLEALFPACTQQSEHSDAGFIPHLSVGQFASPAEAHRVLPPWAPLTFRVGSVALLARHGNEPFTVRYRVPLGGGPVEECAPAVAVRPTASPELDALLGRIEPVLDAAGRQRREEVLRCLAEAVQELTGHEAGVHAVGSWRLGVAGPGSDLDVVCLAPTGVARGAFFRALAERLAGRAAWWRAIEDARVPVLKLRVDGVAVDVLTCHVRGREMPAAGQRRQVADDESWQAVLACREADLLRDLVARRVPQESYRTLLRAVRAWARAREVHGGAWGYLGGFSWALLAAWACLHGDAPASADPVVLLARFFPTLARHAWGRPVALTPAARRYRPQRPRDRLPVVTLIEPVFNSARNTTRSTARLLRNEWRRAARVCERVLRGDAAWDELFAPVDLAEQSERFLVLTATGPPRDREHAAGQMEGRMVGLVLDLERHCQAEVRPWPGVRVTDNECRVVLGVTLPSDSGSEALRGVRFQGGRFIARAVTEPGAARVRIEVVERAGLPG